MNSRVVIESVQIKRGLRANLIRVLKGNLKPKDGEPIFEEDTGKLKFGDGIHDYESLDYFKTGDVEIENALDGQILIYNAELDKWEPKQFADNQSIEYGTNGLKIAGYTGDVGQRGAAPVSNAGGITWQHLISIDDLNQAVEQAQAAAYTAGQAAADALAQRQGAEDAALQAEQFRDITREIVSKKFWCGTHSEYINDIVNAGKLTEGTIYFIYNYDFSLSPRNN